MVCNNCGKELSENVKFCDGCGNQVNAVQSSNEVTSFMFKRCLWFRIYRHLNVEFETENLKIGLIGAKRLPYCNIKSIESKESTNIGELVFVIVAVIVGLCALTASPLLGIICIIAGLFSIASIKNFVVLINMNDGKTHKVIMEKKDSNREIFLEMLNRKTGR